MPQPSRRLLLLGVFFAALAIPCHACEPIPVMLYIFAAPFFASGVTLGLLVLAKCGLYAWFEKQLPKSRAFGYLLVGNFYSTLLGLFAAAALATWGINFFAVPILAVLLYFPARRFTRQRAGWMGRISAGGCAILVALLVVASTALWVVSQILLVNDTTLHEHSSIPLGVYWPIKTLSCTLAVAASLAMTTLWEGWFVAKLAERRGLSGDYFPAVGKVNLVVFFMIALAAAAWMLPQRWGEPGFLVQLEALLRSCFA